MWIMSHCSVHNHCLMLFFTLDFWSCFWNIYAQSIYNHCRIGSHCISILFFSILKSAKHLINQTYWGKDAKLQKFPDTTNWPITGQESQSKQICSHISAKLIFQLSYFNIPWFSFWIKHFSFSPSTNNLSISF